jgi:hypothetical protein
MRIRNAITALEFAIGGALAIAIAAYAAQGVALIAGMVL